MEEGELFGDGLFHVPAAGIAAEDGGEAGLEVVGRREGRTAVGAAQEGDLPDFAAVAAQGEGLVVDRDEAGGRDADAAQGSLVESAVLGEKPPAAAADRDAADAISVEAGELGVGGAAGMSTRTLFRPQSGFSDPPSWQTEKHLCK